MSKRLVLIIIVFIIAAAIAVGGMLLIDKQLALPTYCTVIGYIMIVIGGIVCLIGDILLYLYLRED